MKVLITSGGCKVPIDDVRHIGNFSSGRYGRELAEAFMDNGHDVIFFMESGSEQPNSNMRGVRYQNIQKIPYKNYNDYLTVKEVVKYEQPDLIISAAAISDYIVDKIEGKISSNDDELIIRLRKGEKVIQSFRELAPLATIVGLKLLVNPTDQEKFEAISKQLQYVDHVIFNDLAELRKGIDKREFVIFAENGKVRSHSLNVEDIVQRLIESAQLNKIFRKVRV